jgi:isopentenyl phosphate kinase
VLTSWVEKDVTGGIESKYRENYGFSKELQKKE